MRLFAHNIEAKKNIIYFNTGFFSWQKSKIHVG